MNLSDSEFTVLRQTIATRGTVRMVAVPLTVIAWAVVLLSALPLDLGVLSPALSLIALAVLAAGFEAVHALNVGVERIGRYLQVYYESAAEGPHWETTAMASAPALPGGGVDPLFAAVFIGSSALNNLIAFVHLRTPVEGGIITLLHVLFYVRVVRARGAAARQRTVDLETFRAIKSGQ